MGDPLKTGTLLGPLHTKALKRNFRTVMQKIKSQGGKVFIGDVVSSVGNFVRPTIVEISPNADVVKEELFVPVLYVIKFTTFEEAMQINNSISPGSSNSIFTRKPHLVVPGLGANSFSATPARATLSALVVSVVLNRALAREFISVKLSLY
ncbi:Aldehyde dehydrogenase family 7 member A1 [Vitis vinifera]|uniref:Aldehyde dehydrogenase family 7 member A1 n=1 Tax=Vitis vinifera TaxID=29760 RepID=A0A438EWT5_VITVI|nr:Aldehyde dehydrogenase family 7 member A1 [Vitis vinifera]